VAKVDKTNLSFAALFAVEAWELEKRIMSLK
jgi:hypothetical protein